MRARYCKTHLFDVDIKGKVRLKETDVTIPGEEIVPPVETPVGKVGMMIVSFGEISYLCCLPYLFFLSSAKIFFGIFILESTLIIRRRRSRICTTTVKNAARPTITQ